MKKDRSGPYAVKAADNMKQIGIIQTGDRRRLVVYLKAIDGEKFIEVVEESHSKHADIWFLIQHVRIPLIKYGVDHQFEPMGPFMDLLSKAYTEIDDFDIDGNVHYYSYGPVNEKGKHDFEGIVTDPGDKEVRSR